MIKIIQINVNRSTRAHDVEYVTAVRESASFIVVAEPNKTLVRSQGSRWLVDQNADAAILPIGNNAGIRRVRTAQGFVVITTDNNLDIVSAYVSPNAPPDTYRAKVDATMTAGTSSRNPTIITGDLNAKAVEWGGTTSDWKGRHVLDWIAQENLTIHNDGLAHGRGKVQEIFPKEVLRRHRPRRRRRPQARLQTPSSNSNCTTVATRYSVSPSNCRERFSSRSARTMT